MNIKSRVERLEAAPSADRVRFRVVVPPKMSREEWQRRARDMGRDGSRVFTLNLDAAEVLDAGEGRP